MKPVDRWAFDIHPVEDTVQRTPDGRFAEQGRGWEHTLDLWQLKVRHRWQCNRLHLQIEKVKQN
jgi:hypothetical protein